MLAFVFASMHFVDWVSENHAFKTSSFIHNVLYELEHAFLPGDTTIRLIGWTTIWHCMVEDWKKVKMQTH